MTLEQRIVLLAQAVGADVKTLRNNIGVLANLTTLSKTDIVSALNETVANVSANTNAIGTLASLDTTAKSNLVAAINEVRMGLSAIDLSSLINDAAGAGLTLTGNTFAVGQGTGIIVSGSTVAVDTAVVARKVAATIGNGAATTFTVTHNLNNLDVVTQVRELSTGDVVDCGIRNATVNTVVITVDGAAPASNSLRVSVVG